MIAGLDSGFASLDSVDPSVECVPALPAGYIGKTSMYAKQAAHVAVV